MQKKPLNKLKIGLVLSAVPGYSETFFRNKIKGLMLEGYQVVLFVQTKDPSFDICTVFVAPRVYKNNIFLQIVRVITILFKLALNPKRLLKFISLERAENRSWSQLLKNIYNNSHILSAQVDWLHFGFATLALQSEHVAKAINAKMAVSIRGFDIGIYPIKEPNCYKLLWNNLDKLHAISYDLLLLAYQEGFKKTTPYQIITPAIDTQMFSNDQTYVKKSDVIRFVSVARLHWKKGLVYTFEALSLLNDKGIAFEYVLIGTGDEYERLVFAAEQLGIEEQVKFLGKLEHQEVKEQLKKADIYIQYSVQEGFCNAVLEAQAMGLLCVVSDAEGLAENVLHQITGFVVPKRNPEELANTIEKLVYLPDNKKIEMKNAAIERIKKHFNIEKQQKEFVDFYEN
ncbi:glycosyltransferase family 4 protein [Xanthomarina gelatinilytica]|uniref:glycosyltransferase family 4 protein n=1 Tax=Xanthomarina gelatinilytica TaxID=1137281 RepID=UPI003AA8B9C3